MVKIDPQGTFSKSTSSESMENRRWDLIEEIFLHIRHSVQEGVSAFGVTVENNRINFTEKKRLVRDLSKLSGIPKDDIVDKSLKKSFGGKREGFLAKVLVSTDKPFIISYDRKRRRVTLTCKYGCWNPFGYGFHEWGMSKECGEKKRVPQTFVRTILSLVAYIVGH